MKKTIQSVIAAQYTTELKTVQEAGLALKATVKDFADGRLRNRQCYLFDQRGGNHMSRIKRANSNGDVWVDCNGFEMYSCCCPDTPVYYR